MNIFDLYFCIKKFQKKEQKHFCVLDNEYFVNAQRNRELYLLRFLQRHFKSEKNR